jgi:hypothetical protein
MGVGKAVGETVGEAEGGGVGGGSGASGVGEALPRWPGRQVAQHTAAIRR